MQRYKLAGCAIILLMALSSTGRSDDNVVGAPDDDPRITKLVARLSDPDPTTRTDARQRLINLGESARPVLRRLLPTAAPQTRAEIDRVLLHIPWIKTGDTAAVRQAFAGYADMDAEQRYSMILDHWFRGNPPLPANPLLRIILNDPCAAVRWLAADAIGKTLANDEILSREVIDLANGAAPAPQAYLPCAQNAPLLAAAGCGFQVKPEQTAELFEKALAMEEDHPSAFQGQMDFVYDWLSERAEMFHQYDRMIHLLREQASRASWDNDDVPVAVFSLFAAQADHGPDADFSDDLRVYQEYFPRPPMIYTLSRLASRKHHPLIAELTADLALAMNGTNMVAHIDTGRFLAIHRWNLAAEREFKLCLYLPGGDASEIYFILASLAEERTDDPAAAGFMESGLSKVVNSGNMGDNNWAKANWFHLRAAQQANDSNAVQTYLDKLLGTDNGAEILKNAPAMAADIIPALQERKQNDLADSIFVAAHTALLAEVTTDPKNPLPKNNLAWLCACANKNLDEAARLADEALAIAPDEAADLDTRAEVYMRMGNPAKAVELETRAVQLKPEDVYMPKQLKRFQTAASTHTK